MSEPRKPVAFRLDDPALTVAETTPASGALVLTPEPEFAPDDATPPPERKGWRFGPLLWSALGALVSLGLTMSAVRFVEELYARAPWLGYVAAGLTGLAALAALAIVIREILALLRLAKVERLHERAAHALAADDRKVAEEVVDALLGLTADDPAQARARAELAAHRAAIIDGADLVRLAERGLMAGPDALVRKDIATAAKRVSVVTALSPRAIFDVLFVLVSALQLVRRIATRYGARPGVLGLLRLMRQTLAHLAITGGMAASDSLVQQLLGHGIAAKLSARLGEGVLNGLLTARLGLAAVAVCRPLPFNALPEPGVTDVAGDLVSKSVSRTDEKPRGQKGLPLEDG